MNNKNTKKDIRGVIRIITESALVAREIRDFVREKDVPGEYDRWTTKLQVYADVLALLTGREPINCYTTEDLGSIIKDLGGDNG